MGQGKKWLYAAVVCLQRHRSDAVGPFGESVALDQGPDGMGAHKLRSIQEGESFL